MSPQAARPPREEQAVYRHLACCVDDSGVSRQALREVAYLAGVGSTRLSVVHVAQTPALSPLRALVRGTAGKDRADMLREGGRILDDAAAALPDAERVLLEGMSPAAAASAWAGGAGVDLLGAGAHRGLFARMTLGSFAGYLAHHAPCAVLLVRPGQERLEVSAPSARDVRVREIMSTPVVTASPGTSAGELARRMLDEGVGAVVVVDPADPPTVVGIVSESDLEPRRRPVDADRSHPVGPEIAGRSVTSEADLQGADAVAAARSAEEVMRREVTGIDVDETASRAARRMLAHDVTHLPVSSEGRLVGIVARQDLLRLLASAAPEPEKEAAGRAGASLEAVPGQEPPVPGRPPYRRIACCVDDSDASRAALAEAARVAALLGARLDVVHAAAMPFTVRASWSALAQMEDAFSDRKRWLAEQCRDLEGARARPLFGYGYPPAMVCDWAARSQVDLLVAASHRGVVERMLLGSFASYLAHHAPCSVLLLRPAPSSG